MIEIRRVREEDRDFWLSLDAHLPDGGFEEKLRDGRGYVLLNGGERAALLRYNLFWDNTPFMNLLFVAEGHRRSGLGKALVLRWEADMLESGFTHALTSTQADEDAQHFYRRLGYRDCGALFPGDQAVELFFMKELKREKCCGGC